MKNKILTEKYRPQEFKDIVGLDTEIPKLIDNNLPHLLFVGPAGTGKTTTAKVIIKKLGAEVLTLNASKDRGIDVIRNKIEPFATKKSEKIKIIFLDEFDATTPAFQTALRNFMEMHSRTTRFIATCNYPSKIIDPLKSRFSIFNFSNYKSDDKINCLKKIIAQENIKVDDEVIPKIVERYKDDIRGAINFLNKNKLKHITKDDISNDEIIKLILTELKKDNWLSLRKELLTQSIEYESLLEEIDSVIFSNPNITMDRKRNINLIISESMFQMYFSFSKEITFSSTLAKIQEELKNDF